MNLFLYVPKFLGEMGSFVWDRRGQLMLKGPWWDFASAVDYVLPGLVNDGGGLPNVSYLSIIPYSACWFAVVVERGLLILLLGLQPWSMAPRSRLDPSIACRLDVLARSGWASKNCVLKTPRNSRRLSQTLSQEGSWFTGLTSGQLVLRKPWGLPRAFEGHTP